MVTVQSNGYSPTMKNNMTNYLFKYIISYKNFKWYELAIIVKRQSLMPKCLWGRLHTIHSVKLQLTYCGLVTPYDIIELGQCRKPPGIYYTGKTTTFYWIKDHTTYLPISIIVALLALLMSGTWTKHHHKPDHGHRLCLWSGLWWCLVHVPLIQGIPLTSSTK